MSLLKNMCVVCPSDITCIARQAVDAALGCTQKLVTTIALPSTGSLATEQLQYTVPCVGRCSSRTLLLLAGSALWSAFVAWRHMAQAPFNARYISGARQQKGTFK